MARFSEEVATEKLASRVGASLLKSVDVAEFLVVESMQEYEDCMVQCAFHCNNNSSWFSCVKRHLLQTRETAPLWDTERWVRNLEVGLEEMISLKLNDKQDTDIYIMDNDEL
jgi:protein O-GlcNAc transferase